MFLLIACLVAAVAAGPITYDERQDGNFNARVDISNIMFMFAIPSKVPESLLSAFSKKYKSANGEREIQDRADVRVMEVFVKPTKPYHVEIKSVEKPEESDERAEVVIAGKRRLESEQIEGQEQDELKLLGATENCGPDRVRDSVTLLCKDKEPVSTSAISETPTEQKEHLEVEPKPEVVTS